MTVCSSLEIDWIGINRRFPIAKIPACIRIAIMIETISLFTFLPRVVLGETPLTILPS